MHAKKSRPGLAGPKAASKQSKRTDYGCMACTCQGRSICSACTHFAAIKLAGPGYRAVWPRAKAIALSMALALAATSGTMAATPTTGPVLENTLNVAVASPTESGLLSCPNSGTGRTSCAAMSTVYGQGAPIRKDGGVTTFTFSTPCPPAALENAKGGFSAHVGV